MNEAQTRAEDIDPALKAAGWGVDIGEASGVPEDNEMSNRTIQNVLRPEHYKTQTDRFRKPRMGESI